MNHSTPLLTSRQASTLDAQTIERLPISGLELMELAGYQCAVHIAAKNPTKILVLVGHGNNGGDGLVLARHLLHRSFDVQVFLAKTPDHFSPDALINYQRLCSFCESSEKTESIFLTSLPSTLPNEVMVVDSLLGIGARGAARSPYDEIISQVNEWKNPVISIDTPSGLDTETGFAEGPCIVASQTLSIGSMKLAHFVNSGKAVCGELSFLDIGFPLAFQPSECQLLWSSDSMNVSVTSRHKYTHGEVHLFGGSEGMSGAVVLSAKAAWSTGVGALTVVTPRTIAPIVEQTLIEPVIHYGEFTSFLSYPHDLPPSKSGRTVRLFGPGSGRAGETLSFFQQVALEHYPWTVWDADALFALSELEKPVSMGGTSIFTPHGGELQRFTSYNSENDLDRLRAAQNVASEWNVWVVSKGTPVIIASPEGKTWIYPNPTTHFHRFGFGDVLAGMISGFLSLGKSLLESIVWALFTGKERIELQITQGNTHPSPLSIV